MSHRTTLSLAVLLAVASASSIASARAPAPAPAAPPAAAVGVPPTPPAPPAPPLPGSEPVPPPAAAATVSVEGKVDGFMLTPNGDIDGLWLADGTQVRVPPHLSAELQAAVRRGDAVAVQGFRLGRLPVLQATRVRDQRSGRTVVDRPPGGAPGMAPPPPPVPPALQSLQASGRIERLIYGPRGETEGVVLSDRTTVRLPPQAALQFAAVLKPGAPLSATGLGVVTPMGKALEATRMGPDRASQRAVFVAPAAPPAPPAPVPPAAPPQPPVR